MDFIPLNRMRARIALEQQDSPSSYFFSLLYGCEFVIKLTTAGFVAAIGEDADRTRYRIEYRLIRATGIGEWVDSLNEVLAGPASAHLDESAKIKRKELNQKRAPGDWQFEAASRLRSVLHSLKVESEPQPAKAPLLQWYRDFAMLRNKTRGHGATSQLQLESICGPLSESLELVMENLSLFRSPWAYIRRKLSGKYRVCPLCDDDAPFRHLRTEKALRYNDGVHIAFDVLHQCRLVYSDSDVSDIFVANGGFTQQKYEVLSYVTGETQYQSSAPFLTPPDSLPDSVTAGRGQLDVVHDSFTNLPNLQTDYVERRELEDKLNLELIAPRHPIITLDGRGGIGKTSTALRVVTRLLQSDECPFTVLIWLSARDIDLLLEGAKPVRPTGITIDDFAKQYAELLDMPRRHERGFDASGEFAKAFNGADDSQDSTLFVFDNFETLVSPAEAFKWIDTNVRLPNKVLITTRIRGNFKADYPIHVDGMREQESRALIKQTAGRLGLKDIVDEKFTRDLIEESEGHPYVMKVLLGEVARNPRIRKVERVMASRDDILEALFERSYEALSPGGRRVLLTLCSWRSVVPELAVEAVIIRPGNERLDVHEAISELVKCSFVDEMEAPDGEYFLSVPLAAQLFGRSKLETSPYRGSITEDVKLLQQFGAAQRHDVSQGVEKRLRILFRNIAASLDDGTRTLEEVLPVIQYVARRFSRAWLFLADLCEGKVRDADEVVREYLRHYVEGDGSTDSIAWQRLADLYKKAGKRDLEVNALVQLAKTPEVPTYAISNAVNRISNLLRAEHVIIDESDLHQLLAELVEAFETRRAECSGTDFSRLAWLHISLKQFDKAQDAVDRGLAIEPTNLHCENLRRRLENWDD